MLLLTRVIVNKAYNLKNDLTVNNETLTMLTRMKHWFFELSWNFTEHRQFLVQKWLTWQYKSEIWFLFGFSTFRIFHVHLMTSEFFFSRFFILFRLGSTNPWKKKNIQPLYVFHQKKKSSNMFQYMNQN